MPVAAKVAEQSLNRKGFQRRPVGGKHIHFDFFFEGKPTGISTYLSHNGQELNEYLIGKMKLQMKIRTNMNAQAFLACEKDEAWYIAELKAQGHLP